MGIFRDVRIMISPDSPALAAFDYLMESAKDSSFVLKPTISEIRSVELQWSDLKRNPFSVQAQRGHLNFYLRKPILSKFPDLFNSAVEMFGPVAPNKLGEYRTHLHTVEEVDGMLTFLRAHGAWPQQTDPKVLTGAHPRDVQVLASDFLLNDADTEWAEGSLRLVTHLQRERGSGLAAAKREQFEAENGRLFCEMCHLDPREVFGEVHGAACIEVHHRELTLARMTPGHKTRLNDLQCLCANCHRVEHSRLKVMTTAE